MNFKIRFLIVGFFFLFSCANDKQTDLALIACEDVFTYNACIKMIIDDNCIICHNSTPNAAGPFPLETYQQVKDKTENGELLNRIQRPDGSNGAMPPPAKMTQSNIDIITGWANNGFEE